MIKKATLFRTIISRTSQSRYHQRHPTQKTGRRTKIKEDGHFLWGTAQRTWREKDVEVGGQTEDF
jgi:hypothetical protein